MNYMKFQTGQISILYLCPSEMSLYLNTEIFLAYQTMYNSINCKFAIVLKKKIFFFKFQESTIL